MVPSQKYSLPMEGIFKLEQRLHEKILNRSLRVKFTLRLDKENFRVLKGRTPAANPARAHASSSGVAAPY